jgi:hypothetical protein
MRAFLLLLIVHSTARYGEENLNFTSKLDFGMGESKTRMQSEDFSTYSELKVWANYQGLRLDEDQTWGGYKNSICRMIPNEGLDLLLTADPRGKNPIYLYFDLTRYEPGIKQVLLPNQLKIYINGRKKAEIEVVGKKNFYNPVEILLDPSEFADGRIEIRLIPSSSGRSGRYWGLWDVFYQSRPLNKD